MQVFVDIKVDPTGLPLDELWEEETKAALEAMEEGKIVSLYKVYGQRRVIGVLDVFSTSSERTSWTR